MICLCKVCGKETDKKPFYIKKFNGNVYCSITCFHQKQKERFPEVTSICLQCKRTFKIHPSDITNGAGKYCSKECKDIRQRGVNSPVYVVKPKFECKQCKTTFVVERWRVKDPTRGQFCSRPCMFKYMVAENSANWRGGATESNLKLRHTLNGELWRVAVLERDYHRCVLCGSEDRLEVDHIKSWKEYPNLRYAIDNGRVLCRPCHMDTPTFGATKRDSRGQFSAA